MVVGGLRWKYNAGKDIRSGIIRDSNGVVYFGTMWASGGANITAVNPDGTEKWTYLGTDGEIWGGLALSNDESIVYACDGNHLRAIYTSNGNLAWFYTDEDMCTQYGSIIVDSDDNIYLANYCAGLMSVDSGGNFRWRVGSESHSGLAIGKSNTVIYYLEVSEGLREVQLSNGNINWTHQGISWGCYGTGISIDTDGTIYYGDCSYFYAINPDGSRKWSFPVSNYAGINNAIGSNGNIWFGDVAGTNSKAIVVTPSGVEVWHYDLPNWIGSGFAANGLALDSNDIVFIDCFDYKLYAINSDGTFRWSFTTGNRARSGITFSPSEDTVYFGSDDGYLYAIEEIPAPPTCGIVAVGDKVMLCPIGNRQGNMVALKSGNAAISHKSLITPLNNQAPLKLDFRSCNAKQGDKIICASISRAINNVLGLR